MKCKGRYSNLGLAELISVTGYVAIRDVTHLFWQDCGLSSKIQSGGSCFVRRPISALSTIARRLPC
jgi:hypothetical protein